MRGKNVLHLVEYLYLGGIERLLEQLAVNTKSKANVYFFSYETSELNGIGKQMKDNGFPVFTYKKKAGRDWKLVQELIRIIKKEKIQVIHTHDFGPVEYAVILKLRFPRIKLVHTQHTLVHFICEKRYTQFFQVASYFYSKIIAVSQYANDTIIQHCPLMKKNALKIISNGVNTEIFKSTSAMINEGKLVMVSVARISREKNLEYLFNTCKLLKEAEVPFVFHHAGTGNKKEDVDSINRFIVDNDLQDDVYLHGFLSDAKIVLDLADIFLTASHTEGHPVAVLEAMSCEKLCFCSDIAAHRELGEDSVILFDKEDKNALAEKLIAHYHGRDEFIAKEKLAAARKNVLEKYSIEKMVDQYVEQYLQ